MTGFAFEFTLAKGDATETGWFDGPLVLALRRAAGLASLDVYRPEAGDARDPFIDDGAPPPRIAMLAFNSEAGLRGFMADAAVRDVVATRPTALALTGTAFEHRAYAVGTATAPAPTDAPFSYVVRYDISGTQTFRAHYLESHHLPLAKLPGIRAIDNFLPLPDRLGDLPQAAYLIGNEVKFDSLAAFNAAMASPARQALRREFLDGPAAPPSTHFPMARTRIVG